MESNTLLENADDSIDSHFAALAQKYWQKGKSKQANPDVIKTQLWDRLEKDSFNISHVASLENLQCLERYLWPTFTVDSTNYHVLLIILLINSKRRQGVPVWALFEDRSADFSQLFRRILSLLLDTALPFRIRTEVLVSVIGAFQSLENGLIRKECAPLVSISIWHNLHSELYRNQIMEKNPQFRKAWRAATRRFEAADESGKIRMQYEWSWLYTLVLEFMRTMQTEDSSEARAYCERFLELLCDLESQFPTRRYVNTLLKDLDILIAIQHSPMLVGQKSTLMQDLHGLLRHYIDFPLNDHTGQMETREENATQRSAEVATLQRLALKHYKEKLGLLALSNHGSLRQRNELSSHLQPLDDDELRGLAAHIGIRTSNPIDSNKPYSREYVLEVLFCRLELRPNHRSEMKRLSVFPTENLLYDSSFQRDNEYDGERPLALPKLNLQYLSTDDFLWRSFILYRKEAFSEIRTHLEETIKRMNPRRDRDTGETSVPGSRMAVRISKPAIVRVGDFKVGETVPSEVRAEIILDVRRLSDPVRMEWERLHPDDVVFLVATKGFANKGLANGTASPSALEEAPYHHLRSAEVVQIQDEKGRMLRPDEVQQDGFTRRPRQLRLIVNLDPLAYAEDNEQQKKGQASVYESMNLMIRRRSRENNFKPVLESIRRLALSDSLLPSWFSNVFLGLGDPRGATYRNLSSALKTLDFRDTFLDWSHLREALPDKDLQASDGAEEISSPPYVLERLSNKDEAERPSEKRRKDDDSKPHDATGVSSESYNIEKGTSSTAGASKKRRRQDIEQEQTHETVKVSSYNPPNMGPYPSDVAKSNQVRFTAAQVEAITCGTQPGLTVVVGPPGTGKTDVAVQIIKNIYHNFPQERILLVAHSNQALNQLFAKIVALDIDERHLLRLGQGERELQLDTETSYGKQGRVERFLEQGSRLLVEVNRLAISIRAPGAHGNSCETAEYFNTIYVQPIWKRYLEKIAETESTSQIIESFPFHEFFQDAPKPLFPEDATQEQVLDIVTGCYRHIEKIFVELQDIQPFEVLRRDREKANYLLVKEARIVAMTTTHAAMRRQDIADLGFHYDNVVMEEAAQITEVENFIPLVMQKFSGVSDDQNLKRVVLCGDHLQNAPIISNYAYRHFANLDQSLFLRLIRLGVPHVLLDKQGRARESIAGLYKWRYPALGSLPHVTESSEFRRANAGLQHDYQFIDVQDYKGKGESQPTPYFIQNLGEAEYVVALYQYMRLLDYPAHKISILTTYAGQRALIRDVLAHRCKGNRLFGLPRTVSTVDKYQGEQNDCESDSKFAGRIMLTRGRYYSVPCPYLPAWLPARYTANHCCVISCALGLIHFWPTVCL